MKEFSNNKGLITASAIFVAVIIIGLLTTRKPEIEYRFTPGQTIEALQNLNYFISPVEVAKSAKANDNQFVYIDLRSPYDFNKGNIQGSVNIPANRILEKESLSFFDALAARSATVVIYDADQSLATGPWMLLLQLGFNNVKILQGGWNIYSVSNQQNPTQYPGLSAETPKYDYAAINAAKGKSMATETSTEKKEEIVPKKKVKTAQVEGGC
jgi:rhodanese-related sulfurtransferase